MSDLKMTEKIFFERLFGMSSGYVLDFTNATFAEFFKEHNIDIYADKYAIYGNSKAKRLRAFWELEPNYIVADVLESLLDYWKEITSEPTQQDLQLEQRCREVINRLRLTVSPRNEVFTDQYLKRQISRIKASISDDPELAIGTAKEVIETCCKTILKKSGNVPEKWPDFPQLVKEVLKVLPILPVDIPQSAKGKDIIRRLINNLSSAIHCLAELRNLYGTGHGKEAGVQLLKPRHAKLAADIAISLAIFLYQTYKEQHE